MLIDEIIYLKKNYQPNTPWDHNQCDSKYVMPLAFLSSLKYFQQSSLNVTGLNY